MYVAGDPSIGLVLVDLPGRLPVGGRRGRGQPLVRPRHRRADGAHGRPPGAVGPGRARARRCGSASRSRALSFLLLRRRRTRWRPRWRCRGFLGYVARLHALAQAPDAAEHRHRRRGGRRAAARRLGRRDRRARRHGDLPLRDRLLLDAAALLGAVAAHEGRVRRGRRADAARRARRARDAPPDPAVHGAALRGDAAAVLRRRLRRRSTSSPRSCSARSSSRGAVVLYRRADRRSALRLYLFSLAYLALLFAAMVADVKL